MNKVIKHSYLPLLLVLGFVLTPACRGMAQTFTTLHGFTAWGSNGFIMTNSDGVGPYVGLTLSGNTLYGSTQTGGEAGSGAIFSVGTDGKTFTNLHIFSALSVPFNGTNSDGDFPNCELVLAGNILYGSTGSGGNFGNGTIFAINTDGSGFTNLHNFSGGSEGVGAGGGLILSGATIYGTTFGGGDSGIGTVFAVNTDGTGFTNLHTFTNGIDGSTPQGGLVLSGNTLYGTTRNGGSSSNGTVFAVNTDGSSFTNLHNFNAGAGSFLSLTNSDGANPAAVLFLAGATLYGTTVDGGSGGSGTVFRLNTDGTGFTNLHTFTPMSGPNLTNSDGALLFTGLILSDDVLYGTAIRGGLSGEGTLFAVNTNGAGFRNLYNFTNGADGALPYGSLILSSNTLYGTTEQGGSGGSGTVFSLTLPAPTQLNITLTGNNVILTWPTNDTTFTLQSTTSLSSPTNWNTVLPLPALVNGQNTVTNPISGTQMFYRLAR